MSEPPTTERFPEPASVDGDHSEPDRHRPTWRRVAIIAVLVAVFAAIVVAHLTGAIGPDLHRSPAS